MDEQHWRDKRVKAPFPVIWLLFVNSALSAIIFHKRHLENHQRVVEKVAILCFVLPFDPTWSTIRCLLRSIAPILGRFSFSYSVGDLNHFKKIWMSIFFFFWLNVFVYESVTVTLMPGREWHGPAVYSHQAQLMELFPWVLLALLLYHANRDVEIYGWPWLSDSPVVI